jgi:hypothetical protein
LIFHSFSGGYVVGVTPVPIPNTEVKSYGADGTAWATVWESRSLPGLIQNESLLVLISGLFAFSAQFLIVPLHRFRRFLYNHPVRFAGVAEWQTQRT